MINQDYAAPGPGVKQLKCTWILKLTLIQVETTVVLKVWNM